MTAMRLDVDRAHRMLGVARLAFAAPRLLAPARMGRLWMGVDRTWVRRLSRPPLRTWALRERRRVRGALVEGRRSG